MTDTETEEPAYQWAIVEIMGHRKHIGRVFEEEKFGAKMLRVDVPTLAVDPPADVDPAAPAAAPAPPTFSVTGWTSHWYPGASIFSFTLTDEASVMKMCRPYVAPQRYIAPPDRYDDEDDYS